MAGNIGRQAIVSNHDDNFEVSLMYQYSRRQFWPIDDRDFEWSLLRIYKVLTQWLGMIIAISMICLVYQHTFIADETVCVAGEQITVLSTIL